MCRRECEEALSVQQEVDIMDQALGVVVICRERINILN